MSIMENLKTRGGVFLDTMRQGDVQYLYCTIDNPAYYLEYTVHREPYLNINGIWEWVCKSTTESRAFMIFRINPNIDDAPLVFSEKPNQAKRLS